MALWCAKGVTRVLFGAIGVFVHFLEPKGTLFRLISPDLDRIPLLTFHLVSPGETDCRYRYWFLLPQVLLHLRYFLASRVLFRSTPFRPI